MILTGDYSAPESTPVCPWCEHPDDCKPGKPGGLHHDLCCLDGPRRSCWVSAATTTVQRHVPDRDLYGEASNAYERGRGI